MTIDVYLWSAFSSWSLKTTYMLSEGKVEGDVETSTYPSLMRFKTRGLVAVVAVSDLVCSSVKCCYSLYM